MKLKDFKIIFLLLVVLSTQAQQKIIGTATNFSGEKVANLMVYNKTNNKAAQTNTEGIYKIEIVNNQTNNLVFYNDDYEILEKQIAQNNNNFNVYVKK